MVRLRKGSELRSRIIRLRKGSGFCRDSFIDSFARPEVVCDFRAAAHLKRTEGGTNCFGHIRAETTRTAGIKKWYRTGHRMGHQRACQLTLVPVSVGETHRRQPTHYRGIESGALAPPICENDGFGSTKIRRRYDVTNETNEKPKQDTKPGKRRDALKVILGGAGIAAGSRALPEEWVRPVISSIILPSHAQLTTPSPQECSLDLDLSFLEVELETGVEGADIVFFEIEGDLGTEASDDTPVLITVDSEANPGEANPPPVQFTREVGEAFTELDGNFQVFGVFGSELEISFDIGNDGTIDCDDSFEIPGPPP